MLPALVGFAAKALLPSTKKVDKDKLLDKKGSAIERAKDQEKDKTAPIVKRTTISTDRLLKPSQPDPGGKLVLSDAKGKGLVKKPSDIINSILSVLDEIQSILRKNNTVTKKEEEKKAKIRKKGERGEAEETLEKKGRFSFAVPSIKVPNVPFIDQIMNFFGTILIGSLVLFIYKNIEEIIKFFQETFLKIQEFFKLIEPIVKPIWGGLKWIVGGGANIIAKIMGIPSQEADTNGIKKNLEEITKKIPIIGDLFKGIQNTVDSIRGYKEPTDTGGMGGGGYSGPEIPLGKGETASANRVYSGLVQRGFTKEEAAAITGNIRAESSFITGNVNPTSGAFGLMQWTQGRKARLMQFAQSKGKPATDLNIQLDYIAWELRGGNSYETSQFQKAMAYGPDVVSKTKGFAYEVERARDYEIQGSLAKRIGAAKSVYKSNVATFISPSQQKQQKADVIAQQAAQQAQVAPTPATQAQVSPVQPVSPVVESVPQITQQADYEVPAKSSMILPIPIGGNANASGGSLGGGGVIPVGLSKREALNSYYQSQLIGFLYKQG